MGFVGCVGGWLGYVVCIFKVIPLGIAIVHSFKTLLLSKIAFGGERLGHFKSEGEVQ